MKCLVDERNQLNGHNKDFNFEQDKSKTIKIENANRKYA